MLTMLSQLRKHFSRRNIKWGGGRSTGILRLDHEGRILVANQSAARLLGKQLVALREEFIQGLCECERRGELLAAIEERNGAGGPVRVRTNGSAGRELMLLFEPAGEDEITVLMVDLLPITGSTGAPVKDEGPAQARQTDLDFLADISHEMRTPLNAVIGFADTMKGETFGPLGHDKYREYAEHIRMSGTHLLDLVSSILDLAKLEADRFKLNKAKTNIGDLARECAAMIAPTASDAGLELNVSVAPNLPSSMVDPKAVRQILINLLSNAVKFTPHGSISVTAERFGCSIVCEVRDTGVGMSDEELAMLGARFVASSSDGVRGAKGNGLGLSLAMALAKAHHGQLSFESAPGEGVRARLTLPIKEPVLRKLPQSSAAQSVARSVTPDAAQEGHDRVLTQLDRIEAYRQEIAARKSAA